MRPNLFHSSPHIRRDRDTRAIMTDVLIALLPAVAMSVWLFGVDALRLLLITIIASALAEWGCLVLRREKVYFDGSALVTGALLALSLPAGTSLWAAALAGIFATAVVKQLFGGIGHNLFNPAMAGRALLMLAFPQTLSGFTALDATATATPLATLEKNSITSMLVGLENGSMGETSALLLLLGGAYLYLRGTIRLQTPLIYLGSFAFTVWVLGGPYPFTGPVAAHVLSGSVMMGAFFIVTDYTTKPTSFWGELVYLFGAGVLTALLRLYGPWPEGVCFAVLLMNLTTPLLDYLTRPSVYGIKAAAHKA